MPKACVTHVIPLAHLVERKEGFETLHGHNYHVLLCIEKVLDEHRMVMDFSDIKSTLKSICRKIDHKVLIPTENPRLKVELGKGSVKLKLQNGKEYILPREDVEFIPTRNVTAEEIARHILSKLKELIPSDAKLELTLYETPSSFVKLEI